MSIPSDIYDFLDGVSAISDASAEISPYVRNHNGGFPAVVYTFGGDAFPSSTHETAGPRIVRWSAMVLSRTMDQAETLGEAIVAAAQTTQAGCPQRVTTVMRDYEPAYDGKRDGIYIHITELEFFA